MVSTGFTEDKSDLGFAFLTRMQPDLELRPGRLCRDVDFGGQDAYWLPRSSGLVVSIDPEIQSQQDSGSRNRQYELNMRSQQLKRPICFSPSGQLVADSHMGPRIFSLESGVQIWDDSGSCEWQLEHDLGPMAEALSFLPSGCGILCQSKMGTVDPRGTDLHILSFA